MKINQFSAFYLFFSEHILLSKMKKKTQKNVLNRLTKSIHQRKNLHKNNQQNVDSGKVRID